MRYLCSLDMVAGTHNSTQPAHQMPGYKLLLRVLALIGQSSEIWVLALDCRRIRTRVRSISSCGPRSPSLCGWRRALALRSFLLAQWASRTGMPSAALLLFGSSSVRHMMQSECHLCSCADVATGSRACQGPWTLSGCVHLGQPLRLQLLCSVEMLLDAPEIRRLPFVGEAIARRASEIPQARRCVLSTCHSQLVLCHAISSPFPAWPTDVHRLTGGCFASQGREGQWQQGAVSAAILAAEAAGALLLQLRCVPQAKRVKSSTLYHTGWITSACPCA